MLLSKAPLLVGVGGGGLGAWAASAAAAATPFGECDGCVIPGGPALVAAPPVLRWDMVPAKRMVWRFGRRLRGGGGRGGRRCWEGAGLCV